MRTDLTASDMMNVTTPEILVAGCTGVRSPEKRCLSPDSSVTRLSYIPFRAARDCGGKCYNKILFI